MKKPLSAMGIAADEVVHTEVGVEDMGARAEDMAATVQEVVEAMGVETVGKAITMGIAEATNTDVDMVGMVASVGRHMLRNYVLAD